MGFDEAPFSFRMNKPMVLSTGEWVMPVTHAAEPVHDWFAGSKQLQGVGISQDKGKSWKLHGAVKAPPWALENMIVELRDGRLWMLIRTGSGVLWQGYSSDQGKTWTAGTATTIASPGSRFFVRRVASGNLLLVNHYKFKGRSHLTARLSTDDGKTWNEGLLLDERSGVSYPDGVQAEDGLIWVVYDRDRQGAGEVLLATFREEDVVAGTNVSGDVRLKQVVNKLDKPASTTHTKIPPPGRNPKQATDGTKPCNKPNVLFIAIDDLRDWVGYLGNKQVHTPNLDRLARRGVHFTRSYCAAPCCNPSRTALMTGLRPGQSGVYNNGDDWRKIVPEGTVTLPLHFKNHGYYVAGAGKIYHGGAGGFNRLSDWDDYWTERGRGNEDDPDPKARRKGKSKSREGWDGVGGIRFGPLDCEDQDMVDYQAVSHILKKLAQPQGKPFFFACGLRKPHMPWSVPRKYYDLYPLDKIELPKVLENDLDDVPPAGAAMARPSGDHAAILKSGRWKEAVQAYLATITFCDAMVGRLIDGFDRSAYKDNTIICLWSDHGWHLGEKQHWRKFALWEEATRAPYLWVVPGLTKPGGVCNRTVDYMQIYPTLCDLAGLPVPKQVEGESIRKLLENPGAPWDKPAVMTWLYNNHAVRNEDWRYIRYANGDEELYHDSVDTLEWTNLASKPEYAEQKAAMAKWLPKVNNETPGGHVRNPDKKAKKARKRANQDR